MTELQQQISVNLSGSDRWLTAQCELRLHINVLDTPSRIKCQPYDCAQEFSANSITPDELSEQVHHVDLSSQQTMFTPQPANGALITDDSYLIFRMQTTRPESMGVNVAIYKHDPNSGPDDLHPYQGHVRIIPSLLSENSTGTLHLTLEDSKSKPGQEVKVTIDYVYVKPHPVIKNTVVSQHKAFDFTQDALDVGHRGMGKCRSTAVPPYILENTIECFNQAAKCGADFIEFDVQVSKDKIPVVFHDFLCRVYNSKSNESNSAENGFSDVSVQELTYTELRQPNVGFAVETGTREDVVKDAEAFEEDKKRLFPTLAQVFKQVHDSVGFNIEIKFPTMQKNGEMEDGITSFMDMNAYLDVILDTVDEYADDRQIIFSCFHPDVCTMLKLKQNHFPVKFLTQGEVARYEPFLDLRTRIIPVAFRFAAVEQFTGVNPISEYILKDLSLIKQARDLGLALTCWGSENNDTRIINTLRKNGVQAVCYDRINEFINKAKAREVNSH